MTETPVPEPEQTEGARYAELRAQIGSQALVAELLGLSGKQISFRERDQTDIRPEAFLALERLIMEKRKAEYDSFQGFRCQYADGTKGRVVVDRYDLTVTLMDSGQLVYGGEYELINDEAGTKAPV